MEKRLVMSRKIIDRTGEINYNNFGSKMEIIKYKNALDIDVYFEEYNWVFKNATYNSFIKKKIRCPYEARVFNIGFLGEGKYISYINKKPTKAYLYWFAMFERCYDKETQSRRNTYKNCKVCEEWHNFQNFAKWFEENYYEVEGETMALDKDILVKNNKIYSPKTCAFVPERINTLFTKSNKARGKYPIGVTWKEASKKFQVGCSIIENKKKKTVYLGLYNTSNEAFQVYKNFKENYIKQVADEYKQYIPRELYKAMYEYEIEIDD